MFEKAPPLRRRGSLLNKDIPCTCILQGVSLFMAATGQTRIKKKVLEPIAAVKTMTPKTMPEECRLCQKIAIARKLHKYKIEETALSLKNFSRPFRRCGQLTWGLKD